MRWVPHARADGKANPRVKSLSFGTVIIPDHRGQKYLAYEIIGKKATLIDGFATEDEADKAVEDAFRAKYGKAP